MPSAAFHLGTAVEGSFEGGAGGMVPSARLLTRNGGAAAGPAPSRREETTMANGGGGPGSGSGPDLAALRPTNRQRGKAQPGKPRRRAPIWNLQAAVFVSVVLNVGLLLQRYVNSTAPPSQQQQQHQACLMHLDDAVVSRSNRRGRQQEEEPSSSVPKAAAGAPSTGKPAVTPDSVINLDQ